MQSHDRLNDMPAEELVVGVLGGMGPQAGADFLAKLTALTPVEREQDHLHVILDSNAKVPDRNVAIARQRGATHAERSGAEPADAAAPGPVIAAMARRLEAAGATLLVMACNTAHAFERDLRAATTVPFVSIIDEAADAVAARVRSAPKRVGVLATQGCIDAGLYQSALQGRGIDAVLPRSESQARLMQIIYGVKLGRPVDELREAIRPIAAGLLDAGVQAVIAGCTEVPLILRPGDIACPLLDSTENLARRTIAYARRLEPLPERAIAR